MAPKGDAVGTGKRRDRWERWYGWHLQRERERLDLSWYELSERLERSGYPLYQAAIKAIEDGTRAVKLNDAVAISEVLGLPLEQMLRPPTSGDVQQDLQVLLASAWSSQVPKDFREIRDRVAAQADRLERAHRLVGSSPVYDSVKTTSDWQELQDQRQKVSEVMVFLNRAEQEMKSRLGLAEGNRG